MKIRSTDLIGAGLKCTEILAPLVAIPLLFVKWSTNEPKTGHLPTWAKIWDTPDQSLPGDLTIPAVGLCYSKRGLYWTSFYWLVGRNRMQGLAFLFAKKLQQPWPLEPGDYTQGE